MPLEFVSTCHDMNRLEGICSNLVRVGMAKKVKDTTFYENQEDGMKVASDNGDKYVQNKFGTKVYYNYLVRVAANALMVTPCMVAVRFWYDKRLNKAGIKISEEGLIIILHSFTVLNLLKKMNIQLGGGHDGKLELDKVAELLTVALGKNGSEVNPFIAEKVKE